jgi:hypothetical protein
MSTLASSTSQAPASIHKGSFGRDAALTNAELGKNELCDSASSRIVGKATLSNAYSQWCGSWPLQTPRC